MGLHICYELALPPERSGQAATGLLEQLRQAAHRLRFDVISPLYHFTGAQCEPGPWGTGDQSEWFFKLFAHEAAADSADPEYPRSVPADLALGFVVHPGVRCEAAAFGLARFREAVTAHPTARPVATNGWH